MGPVPRLYRASAVHVHAAVVGGTSRADADRGSRPKRQQHHAHAGAAVLPLGAADHDIPLTASVAAPSLLSATAALSPPCVSGACITAPMRHSAPLKACCC